MAMTLEEYFQTDAGQQLQTDMAGLSQAETATMMSQLQQAADNGDLHADFNADQMFLDSQLAEDKREEAEYYQGEQAKAAEAGDWETAKDYADKAEYAMEEVKDHGGDVADSEILEAQKDEANLEWADYHQEIADDAAATAASYAESGDTDAAAVYAEAAGNEATVAGDYGASADQGGSYADHTVDTSSTFDATATASTVADTSSVSTVDTSSTTTE